MTYVLWFVGLRGAIAFALAENMPGPNRQAYISQTLCICIFTTVGFGGVTETLLTRFGMKQTGPAPTELAHDRDPYESLFPRPREGSRIAVGIHGAWRRLDDSWLKPLFGGGGAPGSGRRRGGKGHHHDGGGVLNASDIPGIQVREKFINTRYCFRLAPSARYGIFPF